MAEAVQGLRPDSRLVLMGFEAKPLAMSNSDLIMRRIGIIGSQRNAQSTSTRRSTTPPEAP